MKLVRARVRPFALPLHTPLESAHGRSAERRGCLLELESEGGLVGYGEAMPIAGFPGETLGEAQRVLVEASEALLADSASETSLDALLGDAPLSRTALQVALTDLAAREAGESLARHVAGGASVRSELALNALVLGRGPDEVERNAAAAYAQGFRTFKLKLGHDPAADLARVAALRGAVADARIRLDANEAWSEAEAARALEALAPHDIEFLEQPVPARSGDAFARLKQDSPVRLALDEAVSSHAAASHAIEAGLAEVLVLKPALLGGPRATLALGRRAAAAGIDVVVTSLLDSAIGVAHAAECAAALPSGDLAHGLATQQIFACDLAAGCVKDGRWVRTEAPGLGVAPDPAALEALGEAPVWERWAS